MSDNLWQPDETKEPKGVSLYLVDPEGWWKARVKWDGCVDLDHAANSPFEPGRERDPCDNYLHICDLDDLITRLQALKAAALDHFGKDWPR